MKRLNIIGGGQVGSSLGMAWAGQVFTIGEVLCRSFESATCAAARINGARPVQSMSEMSPADLWLISTNDDAIESVARQLAELGTVRAGDIVFHPSGALSSTVLEPLHLTGAAVASVHPVKSFAGLSASTGVLAGTPCGYEGDPQALAVLLPAFAAAGGEPFPLAAKGKVLYHAGLSAVSNYLAVLVEMGAQLCHEAGVEREQALALFAPLMRGSLENIFRLGPSAALTGPIARGDAHSVAQHVQQLEQTRSPYTELYRKLGLVAADLAAEKGQADGTAIAAVRAVLNSSALTE